MYFCIFYIFDIRGFFVSSTCNGSCHTELLTNRLVPKKERGLIFSLYPSVGTRWFVRFCILYLHVRSPHHSVYVVCVHACAFFSAFGASTLNTRCKHEQVKRLLLAIFIRVRFPVSLHCNMVRRYICPITESYLANATAEGERYRQGAAEGIRKMQTLLRKRSNIAWHPSSSQVRYCTCHSRLAVAVPSHDLRLAS